MEGLLRVGDSRGGGLVDVVLFCCGDNFEEDLLWEPTLGVFVGLVELDEVANGVSVTLFKIVEALRRTELKTGIFARRAIVDQAREKERNFSIFNIEKSHHSDLS